MFSESPFGQRVGSGPLNFYLDKSMPTRTQHINMSALVDKPKENGKEKQAQTEGLSPLFSAQYSPPLALEPKKVPRIVEIIDNREVTSLLFRRKLPLSHH